MNRYQFLQEFLDALGPLSEEEKQQISDYYEELICDGLEPRCSPPPARSTLSIFL